MISSTSVMPASDHTRRRKGNAPSLWMLLVAQLNPNAFDYVPADIAPLLNITENCVRYYCRELWPNREVIGGRWRLDFDDAAVLIRRTCIQSTKRPCANQMFTRLMDSGAITADFAESHLIRRAKEAVHADHARRKQSLYQRAFRPRSASEPRKPAPN